MGPGTFQAVVSVFIAILTIGNAIGLFFLSKLLHILDDILEFMKETHGRLKSLETWQAGHEVWAQRQSEKLERKIDNLEGF